MNNRKFKTDKSTLIQEGKQIVNTTEDGKYIRKVTLVNLMLRGVSASQIGDAAGETTRTLTMWMKSVDEHGFESLRPKKQPGRPSRLSKEQKENIKGDITKEPSVFGYNVWDGNTLSDHIGKSYGVALQTRQCERLSHELGFSLIRPQAFPAKGDRTAKPGKRLKKLETLTPDEQNIIVYQDEAHFSIQSTVAREWAAKGSKPQVESYAGRKNASYSGFVIPTDGRLFVAKPLWFNWETTIEGFRQFIAQCKAEETHKRIVLVLDNAPWHKKAKRLVEKEPEYQDIRDRMTFVSPPPYSPDLNPIEQVWRITRREKAHNHFWPDFTSLSTTLDPWFASLSNPNEKLRTLCSFKPN